MKPIVYSIYSQAPSLKSIEDLFKKLDISIERGDIVAIKVHMGEMDNITHVKPIYVRKIVELVKELGGDSFVTDTTTLYGPQRYTALEYHRVAEVHGFTPSYLGCPVIISDGLRGENGIEVETGGKIGKIEVARGIYESDCMVVISHATGHGSSGFGGAIKNVGMGCTTKKGKISQHSATKPFFNEEECKRCMTCVERCISKAIGEDFQLKEDRCTGCGLCIAVCKNDARFITNEQRIEFQERLAEAASGVLKTFESGKTCFINFLTEITLYCDCAKTSKFISPDIGVIGSMDVVALDACTIDLIGEDIFRDNYGVDPRIQVIKAAELGIGKMEYELQSL